MLNVRCATFQTDGSKETEDLNLFTVSGIVPGQEERGLLEELTTWIIATLIMKDGSQLIVARIINIKISSSSSTTLLLLLK